MLHLKENWTELGGEIEFSSDNRMARTCSNEAGCFARSGLSPDALVLTDQGPVPAKTLKADDQVLTHDHGMQTLLWSGRTRGTAASAPVRFHAGQGNMMLTPGHMVLVKHGKADLLFGIDEVLCQAKDLTHIPGVTPAPRSSPAWVHLLFGAHELICVNDVWVESFSPDMGVIEESHPEEVEEILEVAPRLRYAQGRAAYLLTRPVLDHREALLLD